MLINEEVIAKYLEKYFNKIFEEKIIIEVEGNFYVLNKKLKIPIYKFWKYTDKELFRDFNVYSFKDDYIGTIFFFLSGYWEYTHNEMKDKYFRFPAKESFQYKKGILEEPIVEILVERIRYEISLELKENKPKYFITHDIDMLSLANGFSFYKNVVGDIIKRKSPSLALRKLAMKVKRENPFSVSNLVNMHEKNGTKGTFFFMPDIQPKLTPGGYDLDNNKDYLRRLVKEIKSIGGSIGMHYDGRHLTENRMHDDIKSLENIFQTKIDCGRAHFLLFSIKKSFDIYEKSGIKLDTSGGFADKVGFRFGTCKPFRPFSFEEGKEYNIIEMPLIVMDGSLKSEKYMNLSPEEGFRKIRALISKVHKYTGVFTILWHNTSFFTGGWENWEWVYHRVLKNAVKNDFEFVTSKDVIREFVEKDERIS
ncbi:MAG: hypothetical protein FXF47_10075 [Candidatus Mcinerneyibacterium aminivorans]|uniref:DUF7033 domain-containing protein n=1 Tax=Candidatus Mcinerneyibacterium aminivorans TaxID=2703815 RepID=A0A5D0MFP3_9BACT|nr:MAG: hypothetical protein FXF47_10075 [Candidatus Mcinerneyibacterium aminivorans]